MPAPRERRSYARWMAAKNETGELGDDIYRQGTALGRPFLWQRKNLKKMVYPSCNPSTEMIQCSASARDGVSQGLSGFGASPEVEDKRT